MAAKWGHNVSRQTDTALRFKDDPSLRRCILRQSHVFVVGRSFFFFTPPMGAVGCHAAAGGSIIPGPEVLGFSSEVIGAFSGFAISHSF